jgi:hypothetical protein
LNAKITRRSLLKVAVGATLTGGLANVAVKAAAPPLVRAAAGDQPLVWVWKFSADGELAAIRDTLAANRLGAILKTHDGTDWMQKFDRSGDAVTGPAQVERLAAVFEQAGVPFHAWCVVQGNDPLTEARMCAGVLAAGARSLFLDLEPKERANYWQGPWENALAFGEELRRLQPNAWVTVAPDARPWQTGAVPLQEFLSFANAVAPQAYWETFNGPLNRRNLVNHGYDVGPDGVTPELVVMVSQGTFQQFGLPVQPIGQGASSPDMWRRFIASAAGARMGSVSLWRYGSADGSVFNVLRDIAPRPQPEVAASTTVAPSASSAEEPAAATVTEQPASQPPQPAQPDSLLDALRLRQKQNPWSDGLVDTERLFPKAQQLRKVLHR